MTGGKCRLTERMDWSGNSPESFRTLAASIRGANEPNFCLIVSTATQLNQFSTGLAVRPSILACERHVHISHDEEDDVVRTIVRLVVELQVLLGPGLD